MNDIHDERDPRLSHLLSDAVSDVEPQDALAEIHNRTKVTPMSARRPWLYAVGGAVVATAATVAAVAALGGTAQNDAQDPGPAASQTPTEEPAPSEDSEPTAPATPSPPETETEAPGGRTVVGIYFAGETPQGPRLYREFVRTDAVDPLLFGVDNSVRGAATDPDYRTLWPSGTSVTRATYENNLITVGLAGVPADRPAGMSAADAKLALQQIIYSAQAAVGEGRVPVEFRGVDGPVNRMLGESVSEPLSNASENETLALVSVSSLSEGETVSDRFDVSGIANSFEATVPWQVRQGSRVVAKGFATADGWMDKLYPWTTQVNVSKLAPGTYTFAAMTDDPSGGAEGAGPTQDTKTIVVE
jgi:Immunoglobulin-like domain of bacterial spore germination/Sporulation and spore germination